MKLIIQGIQSNIYQEENGIIVKEIPIRQNNFQIELQNTRRVSDMGIGAELLGSYTKDGKGYLVLEFLPCSFAEWYERNVQGKSLEEQKYKIRGIMRTIQEYVDRVRSVGIEPDLLPKNIMFDVKGNVSIIDWAYVKPKSYHPAEYLENALLIFLTLQQAHQPSLSSSDIEKRLSNTYGINVLCSKGWEEFLKIRVY